MGRFGLGGLGKEGFNGLLLLRLEVLALAVDLLYLIAIERIYFLEAVLSALRRHFFLGTLRLAHG